LEAWFNKRGDWEKSSNSDNGESGTYVKFTDSGVRE
jgi:hypothetical protein